MFAPNRVSGVEKNRLSLLEIIPAQSGICLEEIARLAGQSQIIFDIAASRRARLDMLHIEREVKDLLGRTAIRPPDNPLPV